MMENLRPYIASTMNVIGRFFYKLHITPTFITFTGFLLSGVAGYFYWQRQYWWSVLFVLLAGFMDMIDGAIAKQYEERTKAGSLMDSVVDRASEGLVYIGILFSFESILAQFVVLLTLVFSLLISYIRARVESLGGIMRGIGIMERGERILGLIIITIIAAIYDQHAFFIGMIILMVLTGITVFQRFVIGLRKLNHDE